MIKDIFKALPDNELVRQQPGLFYTMIENAEDCFYIANLDDGVRMIYVNLASERHYGYPRKTIYSWHVSDWDPNFSVDDTQALVDRIKLEENLTIRTEHRLRDGTVVPVEVTINHFVDDANTNLAYGWFKNISGRLEMERKQREAVENLLDLYDHAPCGYHSVDSDGVIIQINQTELDWLGYSQEEVVGKKRMLDFYTEEDRLRAEELFPHFKEVGYVHDLEYQMVRRDGTAFPVLLNAVAIYDEAGHFVKSRAITFDLTTRKELERQVVEQANQLQTILDSSSVAITFVKERRQIWANSRMGEMFGYTLEEMSNCSTQLFYNSQGDFESFGEKAYPLLSQGEIFKDEMQMRHRDGHSIWVGISGKAIAPPDVAFGSIWVLEDITPRKLAEEEINKHTREIEDLYDHAPCGYHSLDKNGVILKVNQTELDWLGYRRDELIGRPVKEIHTPESQLRLQEKLSLLLSHGFVRDMELELIKKDGEHLPVLLNATAIHDESGQFIMSRSTLIDIRDRKELEHKLELQAHTDSLTGLNNRGYFHELADYELARTSRFGLPLSLILLDIDHFKRINDTYGHHAGDEVLRSFSGRCLQTLREIDIAARWGGEEFVVLLPGVEGDKAVEAAERLRVALSKTCVPIESGETLSFTVSIGVSSLLDASEDIDAVVKRADRALYTAKNAGRNCVRYG